MKFDSPLTQGRLVKRYKRFLADIELKNGEIITAHCANSGSMMGLAEPGSDVWISPNTNPKAKLDWRWELASQHGHAVGINTSRPNAIVYEWIAEGLIPSLAGYSSMKREVKYGQNSRIDILLTDAQKPACYVEIKNVTLMRNPGRAEFPDAVTQRGTKHLHELTTMVSEGHRAVMLYFIFRPDAETFEIAKDIDPAYAETLNVAMKSGVELIAIDCLTNAYGVDFKGFVEITR